MKRLLDKKYYIKYPNRNEYIHSLFDIVSALRNMNDFVIFKFDFTDFFNSVSIEYVYKKYISQRSFERYQNDLLATFVEQTKYACAKANKFIYDYLVGCHTNAFFYWGYYHFSTSKQLTYRTYQRTLFRQYKKKRPFEIYGSLDW